jgi:hypothetical protein
LYDFISILQVSAEIHKKDKNLLALGSPEVFKPSQPCPCLPSLEPGGKGELSGGEVEHGVANK